MKTLTEQEYYLEAVRAWQNSNKNLKHFAECCYHVSDRATQALAKDCGCSVDTIENYRNAWTLHLELGESERVRKAWDSATIALWVKAAQLRQRLEMTPERTFEYLETAIQSNMTRESFAAHVDTKENKTPQWIRRLKAAISHLRPSRDDWKTEMPFELRQRYDKAVSRFTAELEEIAQEAEVVS